MGACNSSEPGRIGGNFPVVVFILLRRFGKVWLRTVERPRTFVVQSLVDAFVVVVLHPAAYALLEFRHGAVVLQVDVLAFQTAPESLDEDVVNPTPPAIHADFRSHRFDRFDPCLARELASLIGVENLR